MRTLRWRFCVAVFGLFIFGLANVTASAQQYAGPQPTPMPPTIAGPVDKPYPGTIVLQVDVTDTARHVVKIHESVPVAAPGDLELYYPQWIPGGHSPRGPIAKVAGIVFTANGKPLRWVRDQVEINAFHVAVPPGVKSIDAEFQYLSAIRKAEGRIEMSDQIVDLEWLSTVLYPAGYFSRQIPFDASVTIPAGWKYATALEALSQKGNTIHFKPTTLNTLVDSPLYAGANYRRIDLSPDPSPGATNRVYLNLFGDKPADIVMTSEQIDLHKKMVIEAAKAYGSHHYDHYDFLFLLSDKVGGIGLEHHQSSEDGTRADYYTDWASGIAGRDLLAHEYTHSWNGKFRRPANLWTPNFNIPMRDELLWVYEGMTQYYGNVLTARAGMRTQSQARDLMARVAANFDISPGRTWRPMVDTTNQPTISNRSPVSWVSWQRPEDYYTEGMLIWLDVDTRIRSMSHGAKSLDDFAKLFFGIDNGSYVTRTYTFDDLVSTLNQVQPYDWATYLHQHVDELAPETPKDGLTRGGYKLVYTDMQPDWQHAAETATTPTSFATSLGFNVAVDGAVGEIWWNSLAFKSGITPEMQIVAVNGTAFTAKVLKTAIIAAEKQKDPLHLLVKRGNALTTIDLDYHDGLRYPSLERIANTPAYLDDIFSPSK